MNIWLKRGLQVGLFSGGLWLVGTGIASADTAPVPQHHGVDLAHVSVHAPLTVAGDNVNVLGRHSSSSQVDTGSTTGNTAATHGGSVVHASVNAPVHVGGNAVAVLGRSNSTSTSPASTSSQLPDRHRDGRRSPCRSTRRSTRAATACP